MRLASLSRQNMALDLVAVPIGSLVMRIRFAAIDCVGNDRRGAAPGQPVAERGTIVSLVGQQFLWRGQGLQQRHGGVAKHWPPLRRKRKGRPLWFITAWTLVVQPPRLVPRAWSWPPFYPAPNGGP